MTMKGPILVIGATGNQGGHVARALLDAGWAVHAFTRNPASPKAQILKDKGAILVQGDLSDFNSLKTAIRHVTGIFSVQNFWDLGLEEEVRLGSNVIQAAKEAGNNPHYLQFWTRRRTPAEHSCDRRQGHPRREFTTIRTTLHHVATGSLYG